MSDNHNTSISQLKTIANMSANAQPSSITKPSSTNPNDLKFTRAPGMNNKRLKGIMSDYFKGDRLRHGIAKLKLEGFDWEALVSELQQGRAQDHQGQAQDHRGQGQARDHRGQAGGCASCVPFVGL